MSRDVVAYVRAGQWILTTSIEGTEGFFVMVPPFVDVGSEPPDGVLGNLVSALLALPVEGVDRSGYDMKPLMRLAAVKSTSGFLDGTRSVDVTQGSGQVILTPMRRVGSGFEFLVDRRESLDSPSDAELGRAIRSAADRTE